MEYKHNNHNIIDDDPHFIIDAETRAMSYVSPDKLVLIQGDHNSERFTFELPATVDGHEMAESNIVQIHYININGSDTSERSQGVYDVTDLQLTPDGEKVVFSWLVSQKATLHVGVLNFAVRFKCQSEGESPKYVWNTAPYSGVTISTGIDSGEDTVEEYYDILDEWYNNLVNAGSTSLEAIESAKNNAVEDIDDAKNNALTEIDTKVKTSTDEYVENLKSTLTVDVLNYHELLVQEKGYNPDKMMSQKATTEEFNALESEVATKTVEAVNEARTIASGLEERILEAVPSTRLIVDDTSKCKISTGKLMETDFKVYIAPVDGAIDWDVKFTLSVGGAWYDKDAEIDDVSELDAASGFGVLLEEVTFYMASGTTPMITYRVNGSFKQIMFNVNNIPELQNNPNINDCSLYLTNVDKVYRINTPHEYAVNANGIADITKTSTNGLVDTYTISFDNGQTRTFDVNNGNGITSVEVTDRGNYIDTYTMYFSDGSSMTFEIPNVYVEENVDVPFENGYYATVNGKKGDAPAWIRTVGYLEDDIHHIATNRPNDYGMLLYAYDVNGAYLGLFRDDTNAIASQAKAPSPEFDVAMVRQLYPDYKFTLAVKHIDGTAIDVDDALSTIMAKTRKNFISQIEAALGTLTPKDAEYLGFTGNATTQIVPVSGKSIYIKVTEAIHNSLSFYGVSGDERVPLRMQSVDTGASAFYVSYSGTYKINVDGYSQVEMRRENGEFVCDVYLVDEKNVTFSTIEKRPQNAYPIRAYDYKEFTDDGVTIWGVRNGKLLGTKINAGLELYEIDMETGVKTNVGTKIYPYGGANALQCEILDNGAVMFLLNGGRVVRSTDLNTWTEVHNIGMNMYIYGSFRQIDSYKNIVILSEYILPASYTDETNTEGRKLFLSTDYGETFKEIFDLADRIPSVVNGHIHSIAYDRYDDIIWVVTGDTYDMIYFSKDLGETWYQATKEYKDCNVQMTSIIPLSDCVLFGTDCPILGMARYNKPTTGITDGINLATGNGTDMKFDFPFYITPRYIGTVPVASRPAIDYEKSIAYFGYTVAVAGTQGLVTHGEVYATNGHIFKEVYRADETVKLGTVAVYGDFENGRCVAKHNTAGAWVVIDTK